jgi:hypothetical protein
MLTSWGVVRQVEEDKVYRISGELIREWLEPFTRTELEEPKMTEEYVDFELLIDSSGHARSHSEEGDANADTSTNVPNYIRLCADLIERNQTDEALLKRFGQELYDLLFPSSIHVLLQKTEAVARRTNRNLRLRLNIEPDSLASLPVEFAYRGEGDYFLANNPKTVLSRYLNVHLPRSRARRAEDPLHLLAIIANPSDQTPLDPNRWENIIRQALDTPIRAGKIKLHTVKQATFRNIRDALLRQKPSIIQFVGHGMYQDGKGYLALVDGETGATWQVDDEAFAGLLLGFDWSAWPPVRAPRALRRGGSWVSHPESYREVCQQ